MNMASSRSHCIFTLHVESRQVGSPDSGWIRQPGAHPELLDCVVAPGLRISFVWTCADVARHAVTFRQFLCMQWEVWV
jgi:hypothetical protein